MALAKGGIAHMHRAYHTGRKAAGAANQMWQVAQRVGSVLAPEIEKYHGGRAITDAARGASGQIDAMREQAITRYADVSDRINDHSRAMAQIRAEIPANFVHS